MYSGKIDLEAKRLATMSRGHDVEKFEQQFSDIERRFSDLRVESKSCNPAIPMGSIESGKVSLNDLSCNVENLRVAVRKIRQFYQDIQDPERYKNFKLDDYLNINGQMDRFIPMYLEQVSKQIDTVAKEIADKDRVAKEAEAKEKDAQQKWPVIQATLKALQYDINNTCRYFQCPATAVNGLKQLLSEIAQFPKNPPSDQILQEYRKVDNFRTQWNILKPQIMAAQPQPRPSGIFGRFFGGCDSCKMGACEFCGGKKFVPTVGGCPFCGHGSMDDSTKGGKAWGGDGEDSVEIVRQLGGCEAAIQNLSMAMIILILISFIVIMVVIIRDVATSSAGAERLTMLRNPH
jgi:hypothetical protein